MRKDPPPTGEPMTADELRDAFTRRRPQGMDADEWIARCELAACHRLFARLGWGDFLATQLTVRVPRTAYYLVKSCALMDREVTASNLVKVDLSGRAVNTTAPVLATWFQVHAAVHGVRRDALCVMRSQTAAVQVVGCDPDGLRPIGMAAIAWSGRFALHDFESAQPDRDEAQRIASELGNHPVIFLRQHGALVCGASVGEAFAAHARLQQACELQLAAMSTQGRIILPGGALAQRAAAEHDSALRSADADTLFFTAMLRWQWETDPGFCR